MTTTSAESMKASTALLSVSVGRELSEDKDTRPDTQFNNIFNLRYSHGISTTLLLRYSKSPLKTGEVTKGSHKPVIWEP